MSQIKTEMTLSSDFQMECELTNLQKRNTGAKQKQYFFSSFCEDLDPCGFTLAFMSLGTGRTNVSERFTLFNRLGPDFKNANDVINSTPQ